MKLIKKILKIALIAFIWLAIWETIHLIVGKELLVPSPISVFMRMLKLMITLPFWQSIGGSILRILIGFAAGIVSGLIIGVLTALIPWLNAFLAPAARVIRATPVASFIILLFVFVSKNNIPVVTAFLMVLPVVWANVFEGIKNTDKKLLEMAKVFELKKSVVIKNIYVPQILPFFLASVKSGMGLAWKAGVAAEVLVNPKFGIGTAIYESKIYLETCDLFAWTVFVIIISVILEKTIIKLLGKIRL